MPFLRCHVLCYAALRAYRGEMEGGQCLGHAAGPFPHSRFCLREKTVQRVKHFHVLLVFLCALLVRSAGLAGRGSARVAMVLRTRPHVLSPTPRQASRERQKVAVLRVRVVQTQRAQEPQALLQIRGVIYLLCSFLGYPVASLQLPPHRLHEGCQHVVDHAMQRAELIQWGGAALPRRGGIGISGGRVVGGRRHV